MLFRSGSGSASDHPSLIAIEHALAPLPVRRADFEYRLAGKRAPDRAPKLLARVRACAREFADELGVPTSRIVLGGRSMGGRMCSMVAAGVPLVDALESVGGAAGNHVYLLATREIQHKVSTGVSLTTAMKESQVFPNMVVQMCAIGEESGALDNMLLKVAEFYEREVDDAVAAISSLIEPLIIVILGVLIGGMVVAMYLPILDRKSTRLNSSHSHQSRMPSSA